MTDYHKLQIVLLHWGNSVGRMKYARHNPKGLVNVTYDVETENGLFVAQMMSAIFSEETVNDHAAVSAHIKKQGIAAPGIVPNDKGGYFWRLENHVWRVLEYVPSDRETKRSEETMGEAAEMLARLHSALKNFDYTPRFELPGYHMPKETVKRFQMMLFDKKYGDKRRTVENLGKEIIEAMSKEYLPEDLPKTLLHGDPKFDNFLFKKGKAIGVLDFDTLMRGHELLDVGDALRSFCRKNKTEFDGKLFKKAWSRYNSRHQTGADETLALQATKLITLDLALRYLHDAVEENYFQLKREKYKTLHEQNLTRAKRYFKYYKNIERAGVSLS